VRIASLRLHLVYSRRNSSSHQRLQLRGCQRASRTRELVWIANSRVRRTLRRGCRESPRDMTRTRADRPFDTEPSLSEARG
jgi:hypothetical protein